MQDPLQKIADQFERMNDLAEEKNKRDAEREDRRMEMLEKLGKWCEAYYAPRMPEIPINTTEN
jgi:hypothetical protein